MSVGYLILAHREPSQLLTLVSTIRRQSDGPVVIHLDAKARHRFIKTIPPLEALGDVVVISRRSVHWGGFSIVQAALDGVRELLDRWPDVTHVKHLSGQDYPARNLADFEAYVGALGTRSVMEYWAMPSEHWGPEGGMERLNRFWIYRGKRRRYWPFVRRRLPDGVTFYGGDAFWCMSRPHLAAILDRQGELVDILTTSLISDESYFHSLVLNSPHRDEVVQAKLTYTAWRWCATSPNVLTVWDLKEIAASKAYFARKVEPFLSSELIEALVLMEGAEPKLREPSAPAGK